MELKVTAGMNSRAQGVSALLQAFLAALVLASLMPSAKAQGENGVMATYIEYNASTPSVNWDLFTANASCANFNGANPLKWRTKYFWTAFCPLLPSLGNVCGMCLQVTNAATGPSATVRIEDDCRRIYGGEVVIGMDTPAFNQIDNDGRGKANNGQLEVNYQFVNCYD